MADEYDELNGYLEKLGISERAYAGMPSWSFMNLMLAVMTEVAKREVDRGKSRV